MQPNDHRSIDEVYGCIKITSGDRYHLDTTLNEIVLLWAYPAVLYAFEVASFEYTAVVCFFSLDSPFFYYGSFGVNLGSIRSSPEFLGLIIFPS